MNPVALSKKLAGIYRRAGYMVQNRGKQSDRYVLTIQRPSPDSSTVGALWIHPGSHLTIIGYAPFKGDDEDAQLKEIHRQELEDVLKV